MAAAEGLLSRFTNLIKKAGYTGSAEYEIATRGKSVGQRVRGQSKRKGPGQ
jgi:hypothetical protein